jgi:hypothetical protein
MGEASADARRVPSVGGAVPRECARSLSTTIVDRNYQIR